MPAEDISFSKDMETLQELNEDTIQAIVNLLKKKRPTQRDIKKHAPDGFLRLLLIYSKIIVTSDIAIEARDASNSVLNWFNKNIPNVMNFPGIEVFLKLAKEALGGGTVRIPKTSDDSATSFSRSYGRINSFHALPYLAGNNLLPSLRIFLMNREYVLLDSSGDWDDWLYVVRGILVSLDDQAKSLTKTPDAWKDIPWDKVHKHLTDIKKNLSKFDKCIKENLPKEMKVSSRKQKK